MCTDLRLARLPGRHVSGRTMDFVQELGSRLQVVPMSQEWSATATGTGADPLRWTSTRGYVALDAFGFDWVACDGLNDAGLSIATLWLPETDLPTTAPGPGPRPALDLANVGAWILGTCATVAEVRDAFAGVRMWNAPIRRLWPADRVMPDDIAQLADRCFPLHLAVHDALGGDLVIEFLNGTPVIHDNPIGVLTNSPTFEWHTTNLRNYLALTTVNAKPVNLMGIQVDPTGNGSGLLGLPGDVTPPSRYIRATMLAAVSAGASTPRAAVNQVFHALDLVHVPRQVAASGDYTQWQVARDHDTGTYYLRSYDSWETHVHDLHDLGVSDPSTRRRALPLPTAQA